MISTLLIVTLFALALLAFAAWVALARRDGVDSIGAISAGIATLTLAIYGAVSLAFNAGVPLDPQIVQHKLDALHAWAFGWTR